VHALRRHRPLSLSATIDLPHVDENPAESRPLQGFIQLINLYKSFDYSFFGLWNGISDGVVPSGLSQLQKQVSDALPTYLETTEIQAVDLRTSQCWLKTKVWQLAFSCDSVSSTASDITLTFQYLVDVSSELVELLETFSPHAIGVHGTGLVSRRST